jgi:hypothetical protein
MLEPMINQSMFSPSPLMRNDSVNSEVNKTSLIIEMWLSLLLIWSETCYDWKIYSYVKNPIYVKFYSCFVIQMVWSYIYICLSKLVHVQHTHTHTHIYIYILLALRQNLLNINFSGSFQSFQNYRGSFHQTCPAPGRICLSLGFPAYIRGLSVPLRTLGLFFSSTPSLAAAKDSLGDFGSSPPNSIIFLDIWLPFSLGSSNPKWFSLS